MENVIRQARSVVGPVKPAMVRLTFHDCVGGCDGCLNVNDQENAGLGDLVSSLEAVYQSGGPSDIISRADMWALLGIWAVEQTIAKNNEECEDCGTVPDLEVDFKWGRKVSWSCGIWTTRCQDVLYVRKIRFLLQLLKSNNEQDVTGLVFCLVR